MPKQTFYNLKEDKRNLIINESKKEFAEYGYYNSKIQRISTNSKIPVGSFYQYFNDLDDLFFYLIELLAKRKLEIIEEYLDKVTENCFKEKLKAIFLAGIDFTIHEDKAYELSCVLNSLIKDPNMSAKYQSLIKNTPNFFEELVLEGIQNKEIRSDMTTELFSIIFFKLHEGIISYLGLLEDKNKLDETKLNRLVDLEMSLLFNGIKGENND